jgi:hypothetical protein
MKKCLYGVSCIIFISALLFSCANNTAAAAADENSRTLRTETEEKNASIQWTRELETMRLKEDITITDGVDRSVKLTPQSAAVIFSDVKPVYPSVPGFGSLDTSLLPPDARSVLDSFTSAVSKGQGAESSVAKEYLFSYVLFCDDLKTQWMQLFGEPYPEAVSEDDPLFSSVVYGEPFIDEEDLQIPVRLIRKENHADILVSAEKTPDGYRINQIKINNRRNTDGNQGSDGN